MSFSRAVPFVAVAIVASGCSATPRVAAATASFANVDSAVAVELRQTRTPGIAVSIVAGDRVVYAKGYGNSATQGGVPVTPNTIFRIASVTKILTAVTLLGAADSAGVSLDSPIGDRVGELPAPFRSLTLHQLLSHTAGLTIGPIPETSGDSTGALASAVSQVPARAAFLSPGEIFSYSNLGYVLAGRAIEVITRQSFADAVQRRLLLPLGMASTRFGTVAPSLGAASGLLELPPGAQPLSVGGAESWPFAGLSSTALDLSRFAIAFVNGGRYEGRQVFTPATISRISKPISPFVSGEGDYGYGVRVYRHRGVDVVEHGGRGQDGFRSLLYMVPSRRVAVIVLANSAGRRPYGIADAALDALLSSELAPVPPEPRFVAMDSIEMSKYVGRYASGMLAEVVIDRGALALRQGASFIPIRKLSNGLFTAGEGESAVYVAFVMRGDRAAFMHMNMRAYRRMN